MLQNLRTHKASHVKLGKDWGQLGDLDKARV